MTTKLTTRMFKYIVKHKRCTLCQVYEVLKGSWCGYFNVPCLKCNCGKGRIVRWYCK